MKRRKVKKILWQICPYAGNLLRQSFQDIFVTSKFCISIVQWHLCYRIKGQKWLFSLKIIINLLKTKNYVLPHPVTFFCRNQQPSFSFSTKPCKNLKPKKWRTLHIQIGEHRQNTSKNKRHWAGKWWIIGGVPMTIQELVVGIGRKYHAWICNFRSCNECW